MIFKDSFCNNNKWANTLESVAFCDRNEPVVISKRQGIYAEKTEFKIYYSGEEVYAKRLKELSPLPDMPGSGILLHPVTQHGLFLSSSL